MILTRSPHYITVPLVSPLTSATCTEYSIYIYVWSGDKATVPATPTYTITKENYEASTGNEDIDISRIVDGELDRTLTELTDIAQSDDCQKWVKTEVYYTTSDPLDNGEAQLGITDLATRGYGYGMDGKNPNGEYVMLAGDIFKVAYGSKFLFPINTDMLVGGENVTASSLPDGDLSFYDYFTPSTNTDRVIRYVVIDTEDLTSDTRINLYTDGTQAATILIDYDTRYTNTDVVFFNQYGAQQVLSMRKEKVESMTVESESYESSGLQPSDGFHQFVNYNVNAKTNVKMSSGYIPQSSNEAFKQLMLSDRIWLLTDGVYTPANIITNNITYKTRANDKVVNYDITFGHSFYEVNNV